MYPDDGPATAGLVLILLILLLLAVVHVVLNQ